MINSEIVWNGSPFLCKTQHIRNEKLYATTITMSIYITRRNYSNDEIIVNEKTTTESTVY